MEENGIIRKFRFFWVSFFCLVVKKNGKVRFCVDYRKLNVVINLDVFLLLRV